jgi:hypothetical protein
MEEESGPPVGGTPEPTTPPLRTPITLVPPPLTLDQADKLAKAIIALEELIDSLGTVSGALAKFVLGKVLEGLKAMGPIPPLGPPMGTQEPTTPTP